MFYTKYYPSPLYEYDSRGFITINVPFNGKVVGTVKYSTSTGNTGTDNLVEVSYLHNDYLATPKLITNSVGSTTEVIKRDVWGSMINDNYNSSDVIPTSFGLTGHKADEQSKLTYAHSRYLSNDSKVWLSHDPFSINNFSNITWLMNPQIQNSYSYASNNPVNMVDPDGRKPSVLEAAYMASDIYNSHENRGQGLQGMWNYHSEITGGNGMVAGIYVRHGADTPNEYSFVFKGTSELVNWKDNAYQPFGKSPDARLAFGDEMAKFFKASCVGEGTDCTAVGHSKGGPESSFAAVYFGMDAITFNPARANYRANDLVKNVKKYTGVIDNYIVKGELLDSTLGIIPLLGNTYYVNPANTYIGNMEFESGPFVKSVSSVNFLLSSYNSYKQHGSNSVINSLEKAGIK